MCVSGDSVGQRNERGRARSALFFLRIGRAVWRLFSTSCAPIGLLLEVGLGVSVKNVLVRIRGQGSWRGTSV